MCTGLELAGVGLALGAAGAGTQIAAGQKETHNMQGAVEAELARQRGFQDQATAAYLRNLNLVKPQQVAQQRQQASQQALGQYQASKTNTIGLGPQSPTAQNYLSSSPGEQAREQQSNQAAANLQGYGGMSLAENLGNIGTNSAIGLQQNYARQSQAVLPYEMQQAQMSGQDMAMAGKLLGLLGSAVGMGGATGLISSVPATTAGSAAALGAGPIDLAPVSVSGAADVAAQAAPYMSQIPAYGSDLFQAGYQLPGIGQGLYGGMMLPSYY